MRALRPDKLTLAALAATLAIYRDARRDGGLDEIPTARMLGASSEVLRAQANQLAAAIGSVPGLAIEVEPCTSAVGGGAMPTARLASWAVTLRGPKPDELDRALRRSAVVARIEEDRVWLDVRTIAPDELDTVVTAVRAARG